MVQRRTSDGQWFSDHRWFTSRPRVTEMDQKYTQNVIIINIIIIYMFDSVSQSFIFAPTSRRCPTLSSARDDGHFVVGKPREKQLTGWTNDEGHSCQQG